MNNTGYDLYITDKEREALIDSVDSWVEVVAGKDKRPCALCDVVSACDDCMLYIWTGKNCINPLSLYKSWVSAPCSSTEERKAAKNMVSFLRHMLKIAKRMK